MIIGNLQELMNTREKIMDGAIQVFSEKGYYGAEVDDIAARAGVAKGTIYYYFSSKGELFVSLVKEGFEIIQKAVESQTDSSLSAREKIKQVIHANIQLFFEYSQLAKIFYYELTRGLDPQAQSVMDEAKNNYVEFISSIIEDGIKGGEFRKGNALVMALVIIGAINEAYSKFLIDDCNWTPEWMAMEIGQIILGGISQST